MSAIAGIYFLDQRPVDRQYFGRMIDTLAHHGLNGSGVWIDGSVGLGHQMLWTTPESILEKLPFVHPNHHFTITANARIDNRDELIPTLGLGRYSPEKITDSQIILAAYAKWGEHCPEYLFGDFAFAIWDSQKQQIFCARDPMGVKPLYYYRSNHIFAFASEITALLALPEIPKHLNEARIADHLALLCEDQTATCYQDVFRLPSAHCLSTGRNKLEIRAYWALDPNREIRFNSNAEYADAFRSIFTEAVRCRLRSAFSIGSTLSGGLDSSSIACTARQLLTPSDKSLHTFSAIFPGLPPAELRIVDERQYIQAVHEISGFDPHFVHADKLNPLIEPLWQSYEVALAPNLYIHHALYQSAQEHGVRVFLDGFDGDSTISHGWRYLTQLFYTGHWRTLAQEVTLTAQRYQVGRGRIFWQHCLSPLLMEPLAYLQQRLSWGNAFPANALISPEFARQVGLAERLRSLASHHPAMVLTPKQDHWMSLTTGLYPYALEVADRLAAQFSLEARYPFFDRRLIEFCFALPASQKFRQGWTRAILRTAMTDVLPPKVQWRVRKSNLSPNFNRRLLAAEKATIDNILNHPKSIQPYVNLPAFRAAYERYVAQPQASGEDAIAIFSVVTLALWLRQLQFPV
jgi:asparagine synthase (glutamine-hydrolysing)